MIFDLALFDIAAGKVANFAKSFTNILETEVAFLIDNTKAIPATSATIIDVEAVEGINAQMPVLNAVKMAEELNYSAVKYGSRVADNALKVVEKNPKLGFSKDGIYYVIKESTGIVWDSIKVTDKMYPSTKIPKSFEILIGENKLWVHPNATKHMWQYLVKFKSVTHSTPLNSQIILTDFRMAIEEVLEKGLIYDEIFNIGRWELLIGKPKKKGLLPVVYHANFILKGCI